MRLDFSQERVLAVLAHPDDAELLCAGTLARARAAGAAIGMCVLCRGDKGQTDPPIDNLEELRVGELREAAAILGAVLLTGGHGDGELSDTFAARCQLIEQFRQFRPTLVLAHSLQDYHPDHRAAGALAEAASWLCASPGQITASAPLAAPPALWWMDTVTMAGFLPTLLLDISQFVDVKRQMLACHRSQLQRATQRGFSPLEPLMLQQCGARGAQAGVAAAEAFQTYPAWKRARAW